MKDSNQKKKGNVNWLFAFLGVALLIAGVIIILVSENFKKSAVQTTAVIYDIQVETNIDDEDTYTVFVSFNVDDVEYEGALGYHTAWMRVGQTVKIHYDPANPEKFMGSSEGITAAIVCLILGAALSAVGFLPLINRKKNTGNHPESLEV